MNIIILIIYYCNYYECIIILIMLQDKNTCPKTNKKNEGKETKSEKERKK